MREKIIPLLSPYANKIAVFGSFARGDDTPESDIYLKITILDGMVAVLSHAWVIG